MGLWFSAGNEVDLEIPDFVAHMAADPRIRVIALLMEGVKDGRRLTPPCGWRARGKPWWRAAAGAVAYRPVNSAVFRQFGAIEVDDLDQLLAVSQLLTRASAKSGNGLCIYTFSGGTAALAADLAGAARLPMAGLAPATQAALAALLPDFASIGNPVDTTADILRNPEVSAECLRILCADPSVGTVLYPIPMDYGAITDAMAEPIVSVASRTDTLIVPVWMSRRLSDGYSVMERAGLLPFLSLSDAIAALSRAIAWKGEPAPRRPAPAASDARALSEADAKAMLRDAGLPMPAGRIARSADEAAAHAAALGFPWS